MFLKVCSNIRSPFWRAIVRLHSRAELRPYCPEMLSVVQMAARPRFNRGQFAARGRDEPRPNGATSVPDRLGHGDRTAIRSGRAFDRRWREDIDELIFPVGDQ